MDSYHDVSIVVVDRNRSAFLERCIRSCTAQTYPGRSCEIVLLHDGANPVVDDVLANYGRRQGIDAHATEMESGAILKAAIRNSTGRFIVFVDPDDFISDYMILFQTVFLYDNAACGAVTVDYWLVEADSDRKLARISAREKPILEGTMFRKDLLVKLTRSEDPPLGYEPARLREILMRNTTIGHLPVSFYRKSAAKADPPSEPMTLSVP